MKPRFIFLIGLGLCVAGNAALADTAATPPAGYYQLTVRGAGDTLVGIPLLPRPALLARVSAVSASSLTLTAVTPPADGAYAPAGGLVYTVQFMTGALEGMTYPVTANTAGVFTLDTQGDDLTTHGLGAIAASATTGDLVHVRASWTVGGVFGSTSGTLTLSPVPNLTGATYASGDVVLVPNNSGAGLDKAPAAELGFVSGQGWRQRGTPGVDAAQQSLISGVPFTVRRQSAAATSVWVVGYAPQERGVIRLPAIVAGGEQDFGVTPLHPVARSVVDLQLSAVLVPSPDGLNYGDGVIDFASSRRGFSPPAEHRLYFTAAGWREGDASADAYVLAAEGGFILRRRGVHPVSYWLQPLPYTR